jgi:hypothetical protein
MNMPKLQTLSITNSSTTHEALQRLASCQHLDVYLNFDDPQTSFHDRLPQYIDDQMLQIISTIPKLRKLRADGSITDTGVAYLAGHKHLRHLEIGGNLTDAHLQSIARIPNLESFEADSNISNEGLRSFSHEHLIHLNLQMAEKILPQTLQIISKNFPRLQELVYDLKPAYIIPYDESLIVRGVKSWQNRRNEDLFINTIVPIKQLKVLHTNLEPENVQKLRALRPDLEVCRAKRNGH